MKATRRQARHRKVRFSVIGTSNCPRLSIYRGHKHLYAQVIDDSRARTLIGLSDKAVRGGGRGLERAKALGQEIARRAQETKIKTMVFDRGGFHYHGQIKALAEAVREEGIII